MAVLLPVLFVLLFHSISGSYTYWSHDGNKHLILEAAHPSPLARGAYFGSQHFSQANAYLKAHGMEEINWELPLFGSI